MLLYKVLSKLSTNETYKKNMLGAKKGIDFENNLLSEIVNDGEYISYSNAALKKHKNFKEFKKILTDGLNDNVYIETDLLNDICDSPRVIYQPLGKQSSPDILFIRKNKVLALECKFTAKQIKAPVWNSGLPKLSFNYIFGSLQLSDVTFFSGSKILEKLERNQILSLVSEKRKELKIEGLQITSKFEIYLRPMYNQKENSWTSLNRTVYENSLIEECKKFES
ncbi:hypothetical protein [Mesoplasma coleopterae]|uniref:hypothetical protein n=1 Tax=Mesoplasma coleopterae TaxID=324078 RepID=UPI000D02E03F|nr:hypothetical protein [Mesoplasma coleopterae]AVN63007.1 hypothetical protein CG000_01665 [Mesoplasma coleopterae]